MTHPPGRNIRLELGGETLDGYLAERPGHGLGPGMVVLHEAFGLNDDIRSIADKCAGLGYTAVAPDLIGGGSLGCMVRAFRDMLRGNGPALDLAESVVGWLGRRPEVDPDRIAVVGFCMGGGFAYLLGIGGNVAAVAPNYGKPPDLDRLEASCPVVASYGEKDRVFRRYAPKVERALSLAAVPNDIELYPNSGHSFMNDAQGHRLEARLARPVMTVGFNPQDADDAWSRIERFFAAHV
jgi:carboxymethylenebutenolidase